MKAYKLKRQQQEQRKQNPLKNRRLQILQKWTREIALEDFKKKQEPQIDIFGRRFTVQWYPYARTERDKFESELWYRAYEKYNFQLEEIEMMWPVYERCMAKLEAEKKKADFMQKKYVPLDSDLFEII